MPLSLLQLAEQFSFSFSFGAGEKQEAPVAGTTEQSAAKGRLFFQSILTVLLYPGTVTASSSPSLASLDTQAMVLVAEICVVSGKLCFLENVWHHTGLI